MSYVNANAKMLMNMLKYVIVAAVVGGAVPAAAQRAPVKLPPRPEVPPAKPFTFPAVAVDSLPNGLRFAVVQNHELPLVVVRTAFAGTASLGASALDPAGKAGAWGLLLMTLREGTTTRTATQISDEVADLGTEMTFTNTVSFTAPSFRTARSTWRSSLDLLADVLMHPTLPEASVTRLQGALASSLDRLPPVTQAQRLLYASLYGAESPMSQFATSASLRGVTRDDLVALKDKYLRPQNTLIVVAGDVTPAEARTALMSAFGSWARGGVSVEPIPVSTPASNPTTIYLKDSPGAAQAFVMAGQLLPGRDHADAVAIEAMVAVLGDPALSAGSRVYTAFRRDRGLSYSPQVQLAQRPIPEMAPFVVALPVAPTVADTAITTLVRVLREIRQDKPALQGELDFARQSLIGRLPGEMERVDLVAFSVLSSLRDRLPPDYLNRWIRQTNALTLAQVQAAASRYLDPDHLAIAVVGDRSRLEAPLRALGMPVVIVER